MASGDITKVIEYDKIEVVLKWNVQVRKATVIMEEQSDGSKKELTRTFERYVLLPFDSKVDSDDKWTHTATDLSGEDAQVKSIAEGAWTNSIKSEYKTWKESTPT
tara:strand:- start:51 stop:365 length:315 start_codon:yes stop_codon:yes gene_type:complete